MQWNTEAGLGMDFSDILAAASAFRLQYIPRNVERGGEGIVISNSTHANSIFKVGHNSESSIRQESEIAEWAWRPLGIDKATGILFYVNKELTSMSWTRKLCSEMEFYYAWVM